MERKFKFEEEDNPNFQEILKTLRGTQSNMEQLQDTVQNLVNIVAEMVAEKEAETASKEREPLRMDFGFLGDSARCFSVCIEYFVKGIVELGLSLGRQFATSWQQWDSVMKVIMIVTVFHVLSTVKDAAINGFLLICKGYQALHFAAGLVTGAIGWTRRIKVVDDIDAYEQLTKRRKYNDESQVDFINRIVNEWKAMTTRLSDARMLRILSRHFPREFLNTVYELDFDRVATEVVLRKWNNFVRIHNLKSQPSGSPQPSRSMPGPSPARTRNRDSPRRVGRCNRCNGDHETKDCSWPSTIQCNFCKKPGHIKAACRRLKGRVQAVNNPLFDHESVIFGDASLVDDPCMQGDSAAQVQFQRDESPSEAQPSGSTVNALGYSILSTLPSINTFADLFLQKLGKTRCLLDTGAAVSVISLRTLQKKGVKEIDRSKRTQLRGFNQTSQNTEGIAILGIKHGNARCRIPFHVIDQEVETIIGYGALKKMRTIWDIGSDKATMGDSEVTLASRNSSGQ